MLRDAEPPPSPVSREALYEAVWTDPVTVVAPRYGLSDVGLVKITNCAAGEKWFPKRLFAPSSGSPIRSAAMKWWR